MFIQQSSRIYLQYFQLCCVRESKHLYRIVIFNDICTLSLAIGLLNFFWWTVYVLRALFCTSGLPVPNTDSKQSCTDLDVCLFSFVIISMWHNCFTVSERDIFIGSYVAALPISTRERESVICLTIWHCLGKGNITNVYFTFFNHFSIYLFFATVYKLTSFLFISVSSSYFLFPFSSFTLSMLSWCNFLQFAIDLRHFLFSFIRLFFVILSTDGREMKV